MVSTCSMVVGTSMSSSSSLDGGSTWSGLRCFSWMVRSSSSFQSTYLFSLSVNSGMLIPISTARCSSRYRRVFSGRVATVPPWSDGGHFGPLRPFYPGTARRALGPRGLHRHRHSVTSDLCAGLYTTVGVSPVLECIDLTTLCTDVRGLLHEEELHEVQLSERLPVRRRVVAGHSVVDRVCEEAPLDHILLDLEV